VIVARGVGVEYDLNLTHGRTLRQVMGEMIHGRRGRHEGRFWALDNVTFAAMTGEIVGVIGRNGAGKSTLLLTIAGILKPDRGTLRTFGRTPTLLTLGAGFDPDLTGRENVYLNGAFLGISRAKMTELMPEIVDFSGLGEFIDVPLRKYSAGMRTRLGFATAAHIEPDILLLDEVLGVGDEEFRERSRNRILELIGAASAIVVVTHDLSFVVNTCTKAIWLHEGQTVAIGDPADVVRRYKEFSAVAPTVIRAVS
jgi:ABC-type polysaccharide/polyol phosphate transport system ATPase subunit